MPVRREVSMATGRASLRQSRSHDAAEISLRRQPTEELLAADKTSESGRKSMRTHAAFSVRAATLKLSGRSTSKTVDLNMSTASVTKQRKASIAKTSQSRALLSKTKTVTMEKSKSLPGMSKRLSNGPALPKGKSFTLGQLNSSKATGKSLFRTGGSIKAKTSPLPPSPPKKNGKQLWFSGQTFVAVRASEASDDAKYYLCRTRRSVYNTTRQVPVTWLTLRKKSASHSKLQEYRISYRDEVPTESILMEVILERISRLVYTLPLEQQKEIERLVSLAQAMEQGNISFSKLGDDVERVVLIDEPPPKKARLQKTASQKLSDKAKKTAQKKKAPKAGTSKVTKAPKEKGEPKRKKPTKKEADIALHPRPDITVLEADPLFETRKAIPYVSKVANSRLVFRAINLCDNKMLTKLLKDGSKIYQIYTKSVDNEETPYEAAAKVKDPQILETVLHEFCGSKFNDRMQHNRTDPDRTSKLGTGRYNQRSLGVRFIRKITASRGSREGNNSLTESEIRVSYHRKEIVKSLLASGLDQAQMTTLESFLTRSKVKLVPNILGTQDVCELLLAGVYHAAGQIIEHDLKSRRTRFNSLYKDVLLSDGDLKSCTPYQCSNVNKKVSGLTAYHCAAASPYSHHLNKLLTVQPDVHVSDSKGRRPIHYAAACVSTKTLKLLLDMGGNVNDMDSSRKIPLHYAIKANRPKNVELLLEAGKQDNASNLLAEKYGNGGVNRRFSDSATPLHAAAEYGFYEIVEILIKHGADINAKLSVSQNQLNPLMMAARTGNFKVVQLLVEKGAIVEQQDRMGRTALSHACKNGATNVVSYLLHLGANSNRKDNSDNTPLHYAAAYGWLFTVRTLLEAGADPNVYNIWQTTPLSVAYLKSHSGIVAELLANGQVDINFRDDDGLSLLFHACSSDLSQTDLCDQIKYMVDEKGASCTLLDNAGASPLHHLARAEASADEDLTQQEREQILDAAFQQSIDIARLLLANGCSLTAVDSNGNTATMIAMGQVTNYPLAKFLMDQGGQITVPSDPSSSVPKSNIMHEIAANMWAAPTNLPKLLKLLKANKYIDEVIKMCKKVDTNGMTPLLQACITTSSGPARLCDKPRIGLTITNPWDHVRTFIKALVYDFKSNPDTKVAKKHFEIDDMPSPNSNDWWYKTTYAEKTATHIMLMGTDPVFSPDLTELRSYNGGFIFRDFVSAGANVNTYDWFGRTPLADCIVKKREDLIQFLRDAGTCDFNKPVKEKEDDKFVEISPLLFASKHCKTSVITCLIDCGSDVKARQIKSDMTCLHLIAQQDLCSYREDVLNIVNKLAEKGFDFNCKDGKGMTALHYAVWDNKGDMSDSMELEVKLIQLGASPGLQDGQGLTALHYVFKSKYESSSRYYQRSGSKDPAELTQLIGRNMTRVQINLRDIEGRTALHLAALKDSTICCQYLTTIGADPNIRDIYGNTALALAVLEKNDRTACNLIQGGANLKSKVVKLSKMEQARRKDAKTKACDESKGQKESAEDKIMKKRLTWKPTTMVREQEQVIDAQLYEAAIENNLNGVSMFITGADESLSGLSQLDAIQISLKTCMYQTCLRLLHTTTDRSLVKQPLKSNRTLLHALAISCEANTESRDDTIIKLAEWMIKAGLKPGEEDDYRCSPIQYALLNRDFGLANFLAGKNGGYKVNYKDAFGRSHLAAVLWRAHSRGLSGAQVWNVMKQMLDLKMNINQLFDLPLNSDLVSLPLKCTKIDPNYFTKHSPNKITALIVAIKSCLFPLAQNLLKSGADPNVSDEAGLSPLMHAVKVNQLNLVKLLLDPEYDPNKKDDPPTKVQNKAKKWNTIKAGFRLKTEKSMTAADDDDDDDDDDEEDDEGNDTAIVYNRPSSDEDTNSDSDDEDMDRSRVKTTLEKEWKLVKRTSTVNLNQTDKNGRTALHYVARPLEDGTFDHDEMAWQLIHNGAKLQASNSGLTPYQEAHDANAIKVAKVVAGKINKAISGNRKKKAEEVKDGVTPLSKPLPDISKSADQVLKRHKSDSDENKPSYVHEVDSNCKITNGELVKDEELGRFYDVLMTKVDVKAGDWGIYNFYQIQLVFQPSKKLYILFTRWGRIEDNGQYQHTPFTERDAAVKEFGKVFREKSGNKWTDINNYEQKPRKYRLVEDEARLAPPLEKDVDFDLTSNVPCKLPDHLAGLIDTLMNPRAMQEKMRDTSGLNTQALAFGQLNKERLLHGQRLLEEIEKIVDEVEKYKEESREKQERTVAEKEAYKRNLEKIADLSNDFFHVIPQKNFSCEKLRPLDQRKRLMTQMYNVSNLLHYQAACKLVLAAMCHKAVIHPADFVYHSLGCKIQLLGENETISQLILKYIWNSESSAKVHAIYKLQRDGEVNKEGARCLLWHGSHSCNILSILHRGLVLAAYEGGAHCWRFGKGIYFSDDFRFSTNYSGHTGKTRFLLLCEVYLGKVLDYQAEEQKLYDLKKTDEMVDTSFSGGEDTIVVRGRHFYSPSDWLILPTGERLPFGKRKHEYGRNETENTQYVVRSQAQVQIRYLVQCS